MNLCEKFGGELDHKFLCLVPIFLHGNKFEVSSVNIFLTFVLLFPFQIMSGGLSVMALEENDVTRFLAASTHLGSSNMNFQMEQYVFKRRQDGEYLKK